MKDEWHIGSGLLARSGVLLLISGILMAVTGRYGVGGMFLTEGFCLIAAAHHFRLAEHKKMEDELYESETV